MVKFLQNASEWSFVVRDPSVNDGIYVETDMLFFRDDIVHERENALHLHRRPLGVEWQ
jgi:hypothetical protein